MIGEIKIPTSGTTPPRTPDSSLNTVERTVSTPSSTTPEPREDLEPPITAASSVSSYERDDNSNSVFDRAYTVSDTECVDLTQSDSESVSTPTSAKLDVEKPKRRFKGHGWAMKGTKLSRRRVRKSSSRRSLEPVDSSKASPHTSPSLTKVYFKVSYQERELAKQLGAKWDRHKKLWYGNTLKSIHELGQHWSRATTRTKAKISTGALPEPSPIGIPLIMPPPLHVRDNESSSMPPSNTISSSTTSRITSRRESLNERLFREYTHFASMPGAKPAPPFVPQCDFDIDSLGLKRMDRWLVKQRREATFPQDPHRIPREYEYYYANLPGANPPPFVPLSHYDVNSIGIKRMMRWLEIQRLNVPPPPVTVERDPPNKKRSNTRPSDRIYTDEDCIDWFTTVEDIPWTKEARNDDVALNSVSSKALGQPRATVVDVTDHASNSVNFIKRQAAGTTISDTH